MSTENSFGKVIAEAAEEQSRTAKGQSGRVQGEHFKIGQDSKLATNKKSTVFL